MKVQEKQGDGGSNIERDKTDKMVLKEKKCIMRNIQGQKDEMDSQ